MSESVNKINEVLANPDASKWLKQGLASAIRRDPVDAYADAETMEWLLGMRWSEMRGKRKMK